MISKVYIVLAVLLEVGIATCDPADYANVSSVELFQAYLRINSTTHSDLTEAVEFWRDLANLAEVPFNVYEFVEGYPIVVLKWPGIDSSQHSIMLNSHIDVVPAHLEDGWTYDPFAGHIDENGDIYGRGTQDMKSISIQYYEALRRLQENNVTFLRDVYMTLMPDEEVGGELGMIPFLQSEEFKAMNVGIALDEGSPFPLPDVGVFFQDKAVWQIQVDCHGVAAHGSTFPETADTATGKCHNVIDRFFAFRDEQYEIAMVAPPYNAGAYTSVNLNRLSGGVANNVIPSHTSIMFDMRLATSVNEEEFEAMIHQWIVEAGKDITVTYISKNQQSPATITNGTNPYWTAIVDAVGEFELEVQAALPPGSTDARHVRNAGYPAFGFTPMPNTDMLLHAVDEHLSVATFIRGIDIYEKIIDNLANIPGDLTSDNPSDYLYKTAV